MKLTYSLTEKDSKSANPNSAFKKNLTFALIFYLFLIAIAISELLFPSFQAFLKYYVLPPSLSTDKEDFLFSILIYNQFILIGGVTWSILFLSGWAYFRLSIGAEISSPGNYTLELKDGKIQLKNDNQAWEFSCKRVNRIFIKNNYVIIWVIGPPTPIIIPKNAFNNYLKEQVIEEIKHYSLFNIQVKLC